jgi:hypothetical protein
MEISTKKTRPGLYLVLAGPDGSGKSTLAKLIIEGASGAFSEQLHLHWRPGVLPRLGSLFGRSEGDVAQPHSKPPHSPIVSTGMILYYWLDFLFGSWIRIKPGRRRNGLVLMERGWWDFAIDPLRYRLASFPSLIMLLGRVLPKPDVVLILEARPETLLKRKQELPANELARQLQGWRDIRFPSSVPSLYLDGSKEPEANVLAIKRLIDPRSPRTERSNMSSPSNADWIRLPRRSAARWILPRKSRRAARGGLSIYHPVTNRGLVAWKAARGIAAMGGFRLLSSSRDLPRPVAEFLRDFATEDDHVAVARANHPDRFVALVLDRKGNQKLFAKITGEPGGRNALASERETIVELGRWLPSPLVAPKIIAHSHDFLVLQPIRWIPRSNAWLLAPEVAHALGAFYSGQKNNGSSTVISHGDFAPWNLLRTDDGWAVIDWESARPDLPPFYDLWHYVVQSHGLLRRPTINDIHDGLLGRGSVGIAATEYARAAGLSSEDLSTYLDEYLVASEEFLDLSSSQGRRGLEIRERLRRELHLTR